MLIPGPKFTAGSTGRKGSSLYVKEIVRNHGANSIMTHIIRQSDAETLNAS